MLWHFLALGYFPNIAAPTRCFPPHMTAIVFCDPPNLETYDVLAQNAKTDLTLRTSIHVLHLHVYGRCITLLLPFASDELLGKVRTWEGGESSRNELELLEDVDLQTTECEIQSILTGHVLVPSARVVSECGCRCLEHEKWSPL